MKYSGQWPFCGLVPPVGAKTLVRAPQADPAPDLTLSYPLPRRARAGGRAVPNPRAAAGSPAPHGAAGGRRPRARPVPPAAGRSANPPGGTRPRRRPCAAGGGPLARSGLGCPLRCSAARSGPGAALPALPGRFPAHPRLLGAAWPWRGWSRCTPGRGPPSPARRTRSSAASTGSWCGTATAASAPETRYGPRRAPASSSAAEAE